MGYHTESLSLYPMDQLASPDRSRGGRDEEMGETGGEEQAQVQERLRNV